MEGELWQPIPGYENLYHVSNHGRVKSLPKRRGPGKGYLMPEQIRKPNLAGRGYHKVDLWKDGKRKPYGVHQLVLMAFRGHVPNGFTLVVDHIDGNPLNNRLDNLRVITHRKNVNRTKRGTSKYTGVRWHKAHQKWRAEIKANGKQHHLGQFDTEQEAHRSYQDALKRVQNGLPPKRTRATKLTN